MVDVDARRMPSASATVRRRFVLTNRGTCPRVRLDRASDCADSITGSPSRLIVSVTQSVLVVDDRGSLSTMTMHVSGIEGSTRVCLKEWISWRRDTASAHHVDTSAVALNFAEDSSGARIRCSA